MTPHSTSFTMYAPSPHSPLIHIVDGSTMTVKNIGTMNTHSFLFLKFFMCLNCPSIFFLLANCMNLDIVTPNKFIRMAKNTLVQILVLSLIKYI
jgi:hypothetical protein